MKSTIVIAAALALCGSAFAGTGVVDTVKKDAKQIGSSFNKDMHRIARGDLGPDQATAQPSTGSRTSAMGAGPSDSSVSSGRQARMDAAYANWQRTHR